MPIMAFTALLKIENWGGRYDRTVKRDFLNQNLLRTAEIPEIDEFRYDGKIIYDALQRSKYDYVSLSFDIYIQKNLLVFILV